MESMSSCRTFLVVCLALCGLLWGAPSAIADRACGGVRLPESVDVLGTHLVLNGAGIRRATVFNVHVYVAGLYLPRPMRDVAKILEPAQTKQIVLYFVRDVSRDEMLDAIREGIDKNAGPNQGEAKKHMRSFERYLPELRAGTRLSLSYAPRRGLEVRHDGKLLGVEKDAEFAELLFRVWLGPKPPDADLKSGLLGAKCD